MCMQKHNLQVSKIFNERVKIFRVLAAFSQMNHLTLGLDPQQRERCQAQCPGYDQVRMMINRKVRKGLSRKTVNWQEKVH